jgi:hypothetical protein
LAGIGAFLIIKQLSSSRVLTSARHIVFIDIQVFHINVFIIVLIEYHLTFFRKSLFIHHVEALQHWNALSPIFGDIIMLIVARDTGKISFTQII